MAGSEKRRALRHDHELVVRYRSAGALLTDWAVNISRGGMFINTRKPLHVGTRVILKIEMESEIQCAIEGHVAWVSKFANAANLVPGMGIRFSSPASAEGREALAKYIESVAGKKAARRPSRKSEQRA